MGQGDEPTDRVWVAPAPRPQNPGVLPDEFKRAMECAAIDLAAAYGVDIDEALRRLRLVFSDTQP